MLQKWDILPTFDSMLEPRDHHREQERIAALKSYAILDTLPEQDYDNITELASHITGKPISLVSLVDEYRQWFKSHHGLDAEETPREYSFCARAINSKEKVFEIKDARVDPRFSDNPLVSQSPHIAFYAGVPLETEDGLPLGSLCVIDKEPGSLSTSQKNALSALGRQVMNLLELRKNQRDLEQQMKLLERQNKHLERFAALAAHDLKSPLNNIEGFADFLTDAYQNALGKEGQDVVEQISSSAQRLKQLVDGLLTHTRSQKLAEKKAEAIDLEELRASLEKLLPYQKDLKLEWETEDTQIISNREVLERILLNLLSNAVKYNPREAPWIRVTMQKEQEQFNWRICDNGPGIPKKKQKAIFRLFETAGQKDRYGQKGTGIGLATVRQLVEDLGGQLDIEKSNKEGTCFRFNMPIPSKK